MQASVTHVADETIDAAMDAELRGLLTTCFIGPHDDVFRTRRYFREPYRNRWIIRNDRGVLVAHAGVHEKRVEADGRIYLIGGVAEVCVHPAYRGRGYVRLLMQALDEWMASRGFHFAVLFGRREVYESSGYVQVQDLTHDAVENGKPAGRKSVTAMVKPLGATPWPLGPVHLPGPTF